MEILARVKFSSVARLMAISVLLAAPPLHADDQAARPAEAPSNAARSVMVKPVSSDVTPSVAVRN